MAQGGEAQAQLDQLVHSIGLGAVGDDRRAEPCLAGADHFVSNSPSSKVGAATIAWLKRYVDGDTRYSQFLGTDHPALLSSELSQFQTNGLF